MAKVMSTYIFNQRDSQVQRWYLSDIKYEVSFQFLNEEAQLYCKSEASVLKLCWDHEGITLAKWIENKNVIVHTKTEKGYWMMWKLKINRNSWMDTYSVTIVYRSASIITLKAYGQALIVVHPLTKQEHAGQWKPY